ncbi:hypothetical protein VNI00_005826 [Paramarasmius palmivorus]|uniref:DOMON domain-containing protein n=1 Tax=Paramarasmius palmivorus TaxID=297713 RepID=A0AAW0DAJ8_9AGAR
MGMGFGTSMAGSPMVIMWSNSDGSVTLSQRQASGHTMPTVVSSPARVATMEDSLTTTSGDGIQFAFNIPSDGNTNPDIIWAFGDESPSSAAADATIAIHLDKGQTKLNFAAANGTNTGTNNDTQSSGALSLLPGHESVVVLLLILGMIVAV